MRYILGIMRQLLSCMQDITSKQKNIALQVKDGRIIVTAATEAMDETRPAVIEKTQGQTAANKRNGAALTQVNALKNGQRGRLRPRSESAD